MYTLCNEHYILPTWKNIVFCIFDADGLVGIDPELELPPEAMSEIKYLSIKHSFKLLM